MGLLEPASVVGMTFVVGACREIIVSGPGTGDVKAPVESKDRRRKEAMLFAVCWDEFKRTGSVLGSL